MMNFVYLIVRFSSKFSIIYIYIYIYIFISSSKFIERSDLRLDYFLFIIFFINIISKMIFSNRHSKFKNKKITKKISIYNKTIIW
jgi:hypothetical protein